MGAPGAYSFIRSFISHRHGKVCGILPVYSYVHKCNALSHVIDLPRWRSVGFERPSVQNAAKMGITREEIKNLLKEVIERP